MANQQMTLKTPCESWMEVPDLSNLLEICLVLTCQPHPADFILWCTFIWYLCSSQNSHSVIRQEQESFILSDFNDPYTAVHSGAYQLLD